MTQPVKSKLPGGLGVLANSELKPEESVISELSGSGEGILVTRDRIIIVKAGLNAGSNNAKKIFSYWLLHIVKIHVSKSAFNTALIQLTVLDPNAPFHHFSGVDQKVVVSEAKKAEEFSSVVQRGVTWWRQKHPEFVVPETIPPQTLGVSPKKDQVAVSKKVSQQNSRTKNTSASTWLAGLLLLGGVVFFFSRQPVAQVNSAPSKPELQVEQVVAPIIPKPKLLTASEKLGLAIASIVKNPKAIKPYAAQRDKGLENFYYEIAGTKGLGLIRIQNKKSAWQITFEPIGVTPEKISGAGNLQELKEMELGTVYKFTNGALKGVFLYPQTFSDGTKLTALQSRDWVITKKTGAIAVAMVEKNMMPNVEFVSNSSMIQSCEQLVKENLKSPASAKFAGFLEKLDTKIYTEGNGNRLYKSYVDSENSFGALLRTRFDCKYTSSDGYVRVQLFEQ